MLLIGQSQQALFCLYHGLSEASNYRTSLPETSCFLGSPDPPSPMEILILSLLCRLLQLSLALNAGGHLFSYNSPQ